MATNTQIADYLAPTTLLQAVNILLQAISSTPVASLEAEDTNTDAEVAINRIGEVLRELAVEGFYWNIELDYVLDPATDGTVTLPSSIISFVQKYTADTYRKRLVVRNQKLYDALGHTYNIGASVKGDVKVIIPFEELPEAARQYATLRGCRRFTAGRLVSATVYQFTKADEDEARLRMEQEAAETDPDTMRGNPHILRMRARRFGGGTSSNYGYWE